MILNFAKINYQTKSNFCKNNQNCLKNELLVFTKNIIKNIWEKCMRKTKIICTIGPGTNSIEKITKLVHSGMNIARINLSHGSLNSHQNIIDNLKQVRQTLDCPLAIMADTKGPEIRIKNFASNEIYLKKNRLFTLTTNDIIGDETKVSVAYPQLINEIKINDKIYANNGMLVLKVKQITQTDIICKVVFGGKLTNGKGLNIPGIVPKGDFISEKDKVDLEFAVQNDVNIIASSFVSNAQNIEDMREFISLQGGKNIKIVAKIENADGVKNLKKIIQASDGLMVARGDLGVEIPLEKLPAIQKRAIKLCNHFGKPVIIATEMLESMTNSIRPTRAEVSDVANSIYEKTSATMLSGETAVGMYPEETVKTMDKIIRESEKNINYNKEFLLGKNEAGSITDSVSLATCSNAISLNAKLIVVFTKSGESANLVARYRISTPILALTPSSKVYNNLSLAWGVTPQFCPKIESEEQMCDYAKAMAIQGGYAKNGDLIVVQMGVPNQKGQTNMLKVISC